MLGRPTPARVVPTASVSQRRMPAPLRRSSDRMLEYSPELDGRADPGEVVWTWVPFEEDPRQGKDRPVVVVGRRGRTMLGLMLSSNDRRDGERTWLALGAGSWDRDSRPSWVRLDRVLTVDERGIRREGSILDRSKFDRIATRLRSDYGWR
ncbi:hypothetical protein Ais01nite_44860 [Asanoa ishikariensis]|nr:type II toxin-antitoxin system PemK/MazF family toxin [Asanoa ishikariensis]GIF66451.1 hypothetical protein Ais01nite_44860 [Asanoa ishikariensis]